MSPWLRSAALVAAFYPVSVLAVIYGNWLVARIELGRAPRLMLDDAKHVASVTPVAHAIAAWGIFVGLFVFVAGIAVLAVTAIMTWNEQRWWSLKHLGVSALATLALYGWVWLDPGRVIEWFFD